MNYSYVEIEYVATSFPPTRTDLAVKLLTLLTVVPHGDSFSSASRRRLLVIPFILLLFKRVLILIIF